MVEKKEVDDDCYGGEVTNRYVEKRKVMGVLNRSKNELHLK